MNTYVALLRGINVGGNSIIKMSELRVALETAGLANVSTYIQSGNIIFKATEPSQLLIEETIRDKFGLIVPVVVIVLKDYEAIIANVPQGWGTDAQWKYNLLFLLPGTGAKVAIDAIGELKPDIESLTAGNGVVYHTVSFKRFSRARTGKLASMSIYRQMTVRNHRTGFKILELMSTCADEPEKEITC